jgi:hypothetical protein
LTEFFMSNSSRLHTELQRLFDTQPDAEGRVRTLVLGISGPADWPALAAVWRGVQTELNWPAPAIAINGVDAFELWMPLQVAVSQDEARRALQHLCARYLSDVAPARWRLWPALYEGLCAPPQAQPQLHAATGRWSAFVAPDLAAVFGDDPSLDLPPGDDAQAEVLARIQTIPAADWQRAIASAAPAAPPVSQPATTPMPQDDPRRFLLGVMNDATVDMVLRVEAAKALLR